jgi:hypothetical protein
MSELEVQKTFPGNIYCLFCNIHVAKCSSCKISTKTVRRCQLFCISLLLFIKCLYITCLHAGDFRFAKTKMSSCVLCQTKNEQYWFAYWWLNLYHRLIITALEFVLLVEKNLILKNSRIISLGNKMQSEPTRLC